MEMVILPLIGQQLIDGITKMSEAFQRYGSAVDASCGYHVHIGAEEFSAYELRRLLTLYHRFEGLFYELVQEGRDKARPVRGEMKAYCKRLEWTEKWYTHLWKLQRSKDIRRYLIASLYPDYVGRGGRTTRIDMRTARKHKYEQCRYYGLNLHTWFERGTVEYRHHEGTLERERLLYWALWCGWFTELASALSDAQVQSIATIGDLLMGEWSTGAGTLRMPSAVSAWVFRTREERRAVLVQTAACAVGNQGRG
jgi:hypothetical protein